MLVRADAHNFPLNFRSWKEISLTYEVRLRFTQDVAVWIGIKILDLTRCKACMRS
jgi:hypothetical protein